MHTITVFVILAALAWLAAEYRRLYRALLHPLPETPQPPPSSHPSLTIIRPIRGIDLGTRQNIEALLASQYPARLELLFVLEDQNDPAYPQVRALVARHRARHPHAWVRVILAGAAPPGRSAKLHAMSVGVRAATGELIGFSDAATRLEPQQLRQLVDELVAAPNAGDVFAPAIAAAPPRTLGDAGYALMLNSWYGAVAAASEAHELPFIMGQLMIFRREALTAIGGVECADGQPDDGMCLGRRVAEHGFHNLMSRQPLRIGCDGLSLYGFGLLMRRWLLAARSGPLSRFERSAWMHGLVLGVALAALVGSLAAGWPGPALFAAATVALACQSDVLLHRELGGAPIPLKWSWVTLTIPLLGPLALASLLFGRHADWRSSDHALGAGAQLGHT